MWHKTRDMWHVTRDMLGGWTFSQNFISLAFTVCYLWYYEDLEEKDDLLTDLLINHKAVYRTGPATPGLLNTFYVLYPCMCVSVFAIEHVINKKKPSVFSNHRKLIEIYIIVDLIRPLWKTRCMQLFWRCWHNGPNLKTLKSLEKA